MTDLKIQFKIGTKESVTSAPIANGSTSWAYDSQELYLDYNDQRILMCDVIVMATEEERRALLAPKNKFYYCKDSGNLWYKNGVWKMVGQQMSTKNALLDVSTSSVNSGVTLEAGWHVKRVTIVTNAAYNTGTTISVKCGDQVLVSSDDYHASSVSDQFDSFAFKSIATAGEITVAVSGATTGSCTICVEYMVG